MSALSRQLSDHIISTFLNVAAVFVDCAHVYNMKKKCAYRMDLRTQDASNITSGGNEFMKSHLVVLGGFGVELIDWRMRTYSLHAHVPCTTCERTRVRT